LRENMDYSFQGLETRDGRKVSLGKGTKKLVAGGGFEPPTFGL
jgi:hypothetical protein